MGAKCTLKINENINEIYFENRSTENSINKFTQKEGKNQCFFDMHADVWTDNFWEYQKGNKDVIRNKYKEKFLKGGLSGGIFVILFECE